MKKLGLSLLLFAGSVAAMALLYPQGYLLAGLLVVFSILAWRLDPQPEDGFTLLGGAVFGPAAEMVVVWRGGWSYAHPDFLGIPIWLPVGWAFACLLLTRLSEAVREIGRTSRRVGE
jgi:hypothetical protein